MFAVFVVHYFLVINDFNRRIQILDDGPRTEMSGVRP